MDSVDLPRPTLITHPQALWRLKDSLAQESILAVDTESNSLFAYQERVCLIQFSTKKGDYLVDPLAIDDLSPLAPIFASKRIEKVFHAAEYDVIMLKRDFNFRFGYLFDTMLAARILGWDGLGLGSILKNEFGVQLNKRYQRANWGKRPIPVDMLTYAQLDTHYLIPLRNRLRAELKANGRWALAVEDFRRLQNVNGRKPGNGGETCWRIKGSHDLSPQQAAVLKELCVYRDQVAKSINRPLFKVIGDQTLYAIAEDCPDDLKALRLLPGMSHKQVRRHGKALLKAVERGLRADPVVPPRNRRPSVRYLARVEGLRSWRKMVAQEMGVSSDVVLPRDLLNEIATQNPKRETELANVLEQVPWRMENFGDEILGVLDHT
jgi:ribonuclease D